MAQSQINQPNRKNKKHRVLKALGIFVLFLFFFSIVAFLMPTVFKLTIQNEKRSGLFSANEQFPVTVYPKNKIIVENEVVNDLLKSDNSPLQAAVGNSFWNTFEWLSTTIANLPLYQSLAAVNGRFVVIAPGMRKEQVANAFSGALTWSPKEKQTFLTPEKGSTLPLPEGSFSPAIYFVGTETTPIAAQTMANERFSKDVLSHYGTSTAEIVSLNQALTIASLIQRETGGNDDMRLISGIIWNRIFANMNLQIDATLQYAKASSATTGNWWPKVVPADKFKKSPYNTYANPGLPPTPISSPSVAAILAALNPIKTSCLFYFHDNNGEIHCSNTYAEHVALLKKTFGQGK